MLVHARSYAPAAVTLAVAVLATAAPLHAQRDYLLRYTPGSEAARLVDGIAARDKAASRRGTEDDCRILSATVGTSPRVAAFAKTIPAERWTGVTGVISLTHGRPLRPRSLPDDPSYPEQWNLHRVDAIGAWDYTTGGSTVAGERIVIGVIELEGIDVRHPDLRGNFYVNPGEVPGNRIDDDGNGYVDDVSGVNFDNPNTNFISPAAHGTHVAGLLGARGNDNSQAAGLNWDARLLPFQIDDTVDWVLALDYLTALRARYNATGGREGAYVVVANCSFGIDGTDCADADVREVDAAIERAGRVGILTAGATTNNLGDVERERSTPSSCASEFLVSVTASDEADELVPSAGFSRERIDLAAPGAVFRSLDYVGPSGSRQRTFSGTSGATPQVAGTLALMYAAACERVVERSLAAPAAVALEMKALLLESVDGVDALRGRVLTGGRLNARRAVEAAATGGPCRSEGVIVVADDASRPPPPEIRTQGARLLRADALAQAWGYYRYDIAVGTAEEALAAATSAEGVRGAAPDYLLVRSDTRFSFDLDDLRSLSTLASETGGTFVGGLGDAPGITEATHFAFAHQGFSSRLLALRNREARALGAEGVALASVTGAVSGRSDSTDAHAPVLVGYRGYRLSDWIAAAALVATADPQPGDPIRFAAGGSFGTASWLPDGVEDESLAAVVSEVIDSLAADRVVTVLPRRPPGLRDAGEAPGAALWPRTAQRPDGVPAPSGATALRADGTCVAEGPAVSIGALTGAAAALARVSCGDNEGFSPSAIIGALRRASAGPDDQLDVLAAARILLTECEDAGSEGVALVYPSPIRRGGVARVLFYADAEGVLDVVDGAGRLVASLPTAGGEEGAQSLRLTTGGLPAGAYFLRTRGATGAAVGRLVVLE